MLQATGGSLSSMGKELCRRCWTRRMGDASPEVLESLDGAPNIHDKVLIGQQIEDYRDLSFRRAYKIR